MLQSKTPVTKALLKERAKDKKREEARLTFRVSGRRNAVRCMPLLRRS